MRSMMHWRGVGLSLALFLIAGCGDGGTGEDPSARRRVAFAASTLALGTGDSAALVVDVRDGGGRTVPSATATLRVLDEQVAAVRGGRVVGTRAGVTAVIGESDGAAPDTIAVTVTQKATGIELASPDTLSFTTFADTTRLAATVRAGLGEFAGAPVDWRTLDTLVARVTPDGVLTGVAGGVTRVVAATAGGAFADTAVVVVVQQLSVGSTVFLTPYTDPVAPNFVSVSFVSALPLRVTATSDAPDIVPSFEVTVPANTRSVELPVRALRAGTATLRVSALGAEASATLVTSARARVAHSQSSPSTWEVAPLHTLGVSDVFGVGLEDYPTLGGSRLRVPLPLRISSSDPAVVSVEDSVVAVQLAPTLGSIRVRPRTLGEAWIRITGIDVVPDSFFVRTVPLAIQVDQFAGSSRIGVGQQSFLVLTTVGQTLVDSVEIAVSALHGKVAPVFDRLWLARRRNAADTFWEQVLIVPVRGVALGPDTVVAAGATTTSTRRAFEVVPPHLNASSLRSQFPMAVGETRSGLWVSTSPAWPSTTLRIRITSSDTTVLRVTPSEVVVSSASQGAAEFVITGVAPGTAYLTYTADGYPPLQSESVTVQAP